MYIKYRIFNNLTSNYYATFTLSKITKLFYKNFMEKFTVNMMKAWLKSRKTLSDSAHLTARQSNALFTDYRCVLCVFKEMCSRKNPVWLKTSSVQNFKVCFHFRSYFSAE